MQKLKPMIRHYLQLIGLYMVVGILVLVAVLHILAERRRARESAAVVFRQMEQALDQTEEAELSHIFSMLRVNDGITFYAISIADGEVVGSTAAEDLGKNIAELGLNADMLDQHGQGFPTQIKGIPCYCVFTRIGENYIGRVVSNEILYEKVPADIAEMAFGLMVAIVVLIHSVCTYINRYVADGIDAVNRKLRLIARGALEERVEVQSSYEFLELSSYINDMIQSLLDNTEKISYVLNRADMRIGVYECNENMRKVRFTDYVPQILALEKEDQRFEHYSQFRQYIDQIRKNPLKGEAGIFFLEKEEKYIKIEEMTHNSDILGIVSDVTEEIRKRKMLEEERDRDVMTGLYNRRGMEHKMADFFADLSKFGHGAVVMIDADGLKGINDRYGHENGDIYLVKIAETLASFELEHCIASRMGGDEFVLLLYDYESEKALTDSLDSLYSIRDGCTVWLTDMTEVPLGFSIGYCLIGEERDWQKLLEAADQKMYEEKRRRKGGQI